MLLRDCTTIKSGKRLPKGQTLQKEPNSHPYIRVKDMKSRYVYLNEDFEYVPEHIFPSIRRYITNTNDILLSIVGTVGVVALVDKSLDNASLTENCVKLVNIKGYIPEFIYYYLYSEAGQNQIKEGIVGSTQPKFPLYNIEKIDIPDFTMESQQHIVDILGTLDEKIENNNKKAEYYEQLMSQYFTLMLSEQNENWEESTLTKIAIYTNGLAMQKYRPDGEEFLPVIKIKELSQGKPDGNSEKATPCLDERFIIDNGDIIFSWSGTLMVKIWCGGKGGLNQHLFKVTSSQYEPWFIYLWTKFHLEKFQNIAKGKAVTMGHIKREDLEKSSVYIPTNETMEKYCFLINSLYEGIVKTQVENLKLTELKQLYLKKFFG